VTSTGYFSTTSIFECATSKRAARFYEAAVGALGLTTTWSSDHGVEIRELILSDDAPPSGPVHLAFRAGAREALDRFYAAALSFGGRDNGPPGERRYHPGYYSAYVLDPDGNNIEAVSTASPKRRLYRASSSIPERHGGRLDAIARVFRNVPRAGEVRAPLTALGWNRFGCDSSLDERS